MPATTVEGAEDSRVAETLNVHILVAYEKAMTPDLQQRDQQSGRDRWRKLMLRSFNRDAT